MLDILFEYSIRSDRSDFSIDPSFERLGWHIRNRASFSSARRYGPRVPVAGASGPSPARPRWHHAALGFVGLGFRHILGGIDHLLFLLCL